MPPPLSPTLFPYTTLFRSWETFSSSRGDILEIVQSGMELPSGVVMFEDPPRHTTHRGLMSRVFTPRRMNALRSEEHTSELQSPCNLVCRLLLEKKNKK